MKARKPRTSRALLDVILSVMALVILLIAPPTEGQLISRAEYVLEVSWPDNVDIDVDTWVMRPDNVRMSYRNKDTGAVSIDRDDLGNRNDPAPANIEITSFRNPPDGYYYVSVHNYRENTKKPKPGQKVWIILRQVGTVSRIVYKISVFIPSEHEETPVLMFELKDKKVVQVRKSDRYITQFGYHP